jgi:hypothetical protein
MASSLSLLTRQLARRRGDYGFDAPYVLIMLGLVGVIFLTIGLQDLLVKRKERLRHGTACARRADRVLYRACPGV